LRGRKIEEERVAIVKTRVDERCSNSLSSVKNKCIAYTPEITNMREASLRYRVESKMMMNDEENEYEMRYIARSSSRVSVRQEED